jgi:hypothetical protein
VGPWLLRGRVVVSLSFIIGRGCGQLSLARGDVAVAALVCLVVVC